MIAVKLGGSLYNTPQLKLWMDALITQSQYQPIIIIPGGGPFADQIRQAQTVYKFSDSHAHYMALLAMAQFGLLLSSLEPKCQPVYFTNDNLNTSLDGLSVWLPDRQLLANATLTPSWDTSSDSLALWLAKQLHAERLLLIKRIDPASNATISDLSKLGIIDRAFLKLYCQIPVPTQIIHAKDYHQFSGMPGAELKAKSLLHES